MDPKKILDGPWLLGTPWLEGWLQVLMDPKKILDGPWLLGIPRYLDRGVVTDPNKILGWS